MNLKLKEVKGDVKFFLKMKMESYFNKLKMEMYFLLKTEV